MTRVVCLGDVMVDVLARLPRALALGSDTPAPITLHGGGSAANTAAWLVRAGMAATFVGRVGDDALGRVALDDLATAGIDLEVSVDPQRPTGTCIVLVDAAGDRTMIPAAGANSGLGEVRLDEHLLAAGDHVHVSAYAVFNPGSRPAADRMAELARAAGATFSVDAASSAPLAQFGPEEFLEWVVAASDRPLLFANRDEALVLAGRGAPDQTTALALGARCAEVIVKCGADGAVWSDGLEVVSVPAETTAVLDSTGAGDAFAAGVLAARLTGAGPGRALRAGNELAAEAITRPGARP